MFSYLFSTFYLELCAESHQLGAAYIEWSSNEQSISVALSRIGHTINANSSALRQHLISNFICDWAQVIYILRNNNNNIVI